MPRGTPSIPRLIDEGAAATLPQHLPLPVAALDISFADLLTAKLLGVIRKSFDSSQIVDVLTSATGGELYLVGGSVRRAVLGSAGAADLDFMVPNGDRRAFDALRTLRVPCVLNRSGHHRYWWNGQQIELFTPDEFYDGFRDVAAALCYFDLKINALALHFRSRTLLDPFGVVASSTPPRDPGINWTRWERMCAMEMVVLAIRLLRIMYDHPDLALGVVDIERLKSEVVPVVQSFDWDGVRDRYPRGRDAFLHSFHKLAFRIRRL